MCRSNGWEEKVRKKNAFVKVSISEPPRSRGRSGIQAYAELCPGETTSDSVSRVLKKRVERVEFMNVKA